MKVRTLLFCTFFLFAGICLNAKITVGYHLNRHLKDTLNADTSAPKIHSARKAALMSAIVPGLGQIYNKKYWKLAIIYPAIGGVAYGFGFNHKNFKVYRDALRIRYDDDPLTVDQFSLYSDDRVVTLKNYYQRYRDLCVIGFAALYVLQVIDAAVDAHLYTFDVGPDLTMEWEPVFIADAYGSNAGVNLRLRF